MFIEEMSFQVMADYMEGSRITEFGWLVFDAVRTELGSLVFNQKSSGWKTIVLHMIVKHHLLVYCT